MPLLAGSVYLSVVKCWTNTLIAVWNNSKSCWILETLYHILNNVKNQVTFCLLLDSRRQSNGSANDKYWIERREKTWNYQKHNVLFRDWVCFNQVRTCSANRGTLWAWWHVGYVVLFESIPKCPDKFADSYRQPARQTYSADEKQWNPFSVRSFSHDPLPSHATSQ